MRAVAQHLSPPSQGKSQNNDHSPSTSLKSAYKVSRNISTLKITAAFPCGAKQPWEHCTVLSVFPLGLAKHSSLENIVIDYFLDPAGIIMAQTNAAAGNTREIERVSSEKWNHWCGDVKNQWLLASTQLVTLLEARSTDSIPSLSFLPHLPKCSKYVMPTNTCRSENRDNSVHQKHFLLFRLDICEKSCRVSKFES